ncbi:hypothetical protein D3C86_2085500 [compost metagenome]
MVSGELGAMAVITVGLSSSVWSACSSASTIGVSSKPQRTAVACLKRTRDSFRAKEAWAGLKRVSAENLDMTISIEQS